MEDLPPQFAHAFLLFGRGLVAVGVIWCALGIARWRRDGIRVAFGRSVPEGLLAAGLVAIWAFTVAPLVSYLPGHEGQHMPANLIPVLPLIDGLMSPNGWREDTPNLVANSILYVPVGIGLRWRFGLPLRWVAVIAVCLSGAVETWQAVSDQMRSSDINDVLLNASGATIGAWLFSVAVRLFRQSRTEAVTSPRVAAVDGPQP